MLRRVPNSCKPTLVVALLLCASCSSFSEGTRRCHALMSSAQEIVKKVDGKDRASVEESLRAVDAARAACGEAGRTTEQGELGQARNELQAHLDYMTRKAAAPAPQKQTAEQLAALAQHGDPSCPKGQAYKRSPKEEIKCTGPQIAEMGWSKAEAYFTSRGYKITHTDAPPTLKVEYGGELVVFGYAAPREEGPPRCLTYYPPPGMSWQEGAGRMTGAPMKKLENAKTVHMDRGEIALHVDQSESKLIVYLGECGK